MKHHGPRESCVVCGEEIRAYESRQYGEAGAVHVWKPHAVAELADCYNEANAEQFPHFYTDG